MFCRLIFDLTTRCNFRCKHCYRYFPKKDKDFPVNVFEKILREGTNLRIRGISISGGEPLLHPNFNKIINLIKKYNYKYFIVTNGSLFEDNLELFLKSKKNLGDICFSLDSVDEKIHDFIRQKGSFKKLLRAFELCRRNDILFRINATIGKANFSRLRELIEFAKKQGACDIQFSAVMPSEFSIKNKLFLSIKEKEKLFLELNEIRKTTNFPIGLTVSIVGSDYPISCCTFAFTEWTFDPAGNLVFCGELSRNSAIKDQEKIKIASLKKVSLKEALCRYSNFMNRFMKKRITDYNKSASPFFINSCEYCNYIFKNHHKLSRLSRTL